MTAADKAAKAERQWSGGPVDLLVIGGGVMGLWTSLKAAKAGMTVLLIEKGRLGHGASFGHMGALMAHMPRKWNAKKQFQFDALLSLEAEFAPLEAETGLKTGFRRSGRLMPLMKTSQRPNAQQLEIEARKNWTVGDQSFEWRVMDRPPVEGWPSAEGIEGGFVLDTLAGRASPRAITAVLIAALRMQANAFVLEGAEVVTLDGAGGSATLNDGTVVSFANCVVAAGVGAYDLMGGLFPTRTEPMGRGVKGQSALLAAEVDPSLPLIYASGLYVIPHEGGRVAIGSTSEDEFDDPASTDEQLEDLITRARELVPALRGADVLERWAGLRPKANDGSDPVIGQHPEFSRIHAMTGGYKISFGIAHRLAEYVLAPLLGQTLSGLPDTFHISNRFR